MNVLIIDNYDSFTYNLYQFVGEVLSSAQNRGRIVQFNVRVVRNDEVTLEQIEQRKPHRIIISPGPGSPEDPSYFGVCAEVIRELGPTIPTLGVCLGMQGIVHVFGGKVVKAPLPMHGKVSPVHHKEASVFLNIPDGVEVMRYHSLTAEAESFPEDLEVTATVGELKPDDFDDRERIRKGGRFEIMGVKHRDYPIHGIQFHPESFATEGGKELIANFLFNQDH